MLGQLSSIDRNEVLTIGGQLAPEIAGILGNGDAKEIQKIKDLIESKCYKAIQHKQALIGDFLKKILADSKDDKKRKRKSA